MTDQKLSIAAQAVLDAYQSASRKVMLKSPLAAAICAAADQVVPENADQAYDPSAIVIAQRGQRETIRQSILAIAADLEAQS
jgi:hypothetical protein